MTSQAGSPWPLSGRIITLGTMFVTASVLAWAVAHTLGWI